MSFGAIGALQIRYRDTLRNPPQTIGWLNDVLARRGAATSEAGQAESPDGAGEASPAVVLPAKPAFLRTKLSIAGIVSAVMGLMVLLTTGMQWFSLDFAGESEAFSGWALARSLAEDGVGSLLYVFMATLVALALVSLASVVLPRVVPIIVGIAGLAVTIVTMFYIVDATGVTNVQAEEAGVMFSFGGGAYLAALAFIVVAVLHFVPATYKPLGTGNTGG